VAELIALMSRSSEAFAAVLAEALPRLPAEPDNAGTVYRFAQG
jgi:hypothetical protein